MAPLPDLPSWSVLTAGGGWWRNTSVDWQLVPSPAGLYNTPYLWIIPQLLYFSDTAGNQSLSSVEYAVIPASIIPFRLLVTNITPIASTLRGAGAIWAGTPVLWLLSFSSQHCKLRGQSFTSGGNAFTCITGTLHTTGRARFEPFSGEDNSKRWNRGCAQRCRFGMLLINPFLKRLENFDPSSFHVSSNEHTSQKMWYRLGYSFFSRNQYETFRTSWGY